MLQGTVSITDDGRLSIEDYRSIFRAILVQLSNGAQKVYDLVCTIKKTYIEFRYIEPKIVLRALDELVKQHMVSSSYRRV